MKQFLHDVILEEIEDDSAAGTPSGDKRERTTVNVVVPPDDCVKKISL